MLLQQKPNVFGIDQFLNNYDTGNTRDRKDDESCNGKIFDKVPPAVTWKIDHVPKELVIEKNFGKQNGSGLLLPVFAKR